MWDANIVVAKGALATPFVSGIGAGTLDPVVYGGFNVSDAYYCFNGADDYNVAAAGASDPTLKAYLQSKYVSYQKYNQTFPSTWRVVDASGVVPYQATKNYSEFERSIASGYDAIYTLIVMLPCEYLWAWLGGQLAPPASGNLYAPWITGNNDPSGAYKMGNFLDTYMTAHPNAVDAEEATKIYSTAMNYELENFQAAGTTTNAALVSH